MIRIIEKTTETLLRYELGELKRQLSRNRDATSRTIRSLRQMEVNHTRIVDAIHRAEERLRRYEKADQ